jgi:acylaminoacyl-peptidase
LGKCGTLDVEDVHASTLYVVNNLRLARFGEGEVFITGGSHGGFIAAHLVSRYPDIYSAAVLRNPVITCGEIGGTDIPDWYFGEFGFQDEYPIKSSPPSTALSTISNPSKLRDHFQAPHVTPRIFEVLYTASPSTALVKYLENGRQKKEDFKRIPPVLLALGASDQRVSPTQGIGFYYLLKGAGETVDILIFDGEGHPIDGVEAAKATWEATRDWLKRFGRK